MFRVILYTQWKWTRLALLPGVIIAFSLPILSVQGTGESTVASWVLQSVRGWAVWFPTLAVALGLLVAVTAWREDHRGNHVYALSLPIERWRYALLRFAAGAVLLAAPIVALWVGSLIATAAASIPPTLRAYPNALALRFALAALVAYGIFFAISAGTARSAGYVLGAVAVVMALDVLLRAAGWEVSIGRDVVAWLTRTPGPLTVFTGRWMLIDV
jgi:ABC-type transport system involved in multi-copper enzyme maturation permease subunit